MSKAPEADAGGGKKPMKKIIVLAIVGVVLLIGIGAGVATFLSKKGSAAPAKKNTKAILQKPQYFCRWSHLRSIFRRSPARNIYKSA